MMNMVDHKEETTSIKSKNIQNRQLKLAKKHLTSALMNDDVMFRSVDVTPLNLSSFNRAKSPIQEYDYFMDSHTVSPKIQNQTSMNIGYLDKILKDKNSSRLNNEITTMD